MLLSVVRTFGADRGVDWRSAGPVCYFMVGIQIFRGMRLDADALERMGRLALAAAWRFPFFLGVSLLEIGPSRLLKKFIFGR